MLQRRHCFIVSPHAIAHGGHLLQGCDQQGIMLRDCVIPCGLSRHRTTRTEDGEALPGSYQRPFQLALFSHRVCKEETGAGDAVAHPSRRA